MLLAANSRGYHMELSDGSSGWVILVNDSQKPIEAFHFKGKCGNAGTATVHDALDSPYESISHRPTDEAMQESVILPGVRFFSDQNLSPQPSGCTWAGDIDGVIYADGSYEGNENVVHALQARRDGILSAARFWVEATEGEAAGKFTPAVLAGEAQRLSDEDRKKMSNPGCREQPITCAYWNGREQVDINMVGQMNADRQRGDTPYSHIAQFARKWREKAEADSALKALEISFPLPPELAPQVLPAPQLPN
ncbi:hypothetical protein [Silvibacterium sp.]|uniref:hypothetical protein n=1 Tax=Silvibacterium sp. TaxID=1964179 RepID=UPI0039E6FC76